MITQDAFTNGKMVINSILSKVNFLNKKQFVFISEILLLFISLRGRHNFLQMSREGYRNEKSFRYQFENTFDWLDFNTELIKSHCSEKIIIGFDPSFIKKSGKHSPGLGYFYSGCQARYSKGLEIGSFAAIDTLQKTAYHLEAIQSPSSKRDRITESKTLVDYYAELVVAKSKKLQKLSSVLVCDAYFTKIKFVDKACDEAGFELIGRMRDDANLRYLFNGKQKDGRGRPRKFDGKLDTKNIDKRRIKLVDEDEDCRIYTAIVNSVGLKRNIRIAYVEHKIKNKVVNKIYFSTNVNRDAIRLLEYYKLRFQMEFIFRDAKQHMGLEHCQARSENKLHFHFNTSLSSVSVAKVIARKGMDNEQKSSISISDIKTEFQNRNIINRIFSIYGIKRKLIKINLSYRKLLDFGKIAA